MPEQQQKITIEQALDLATKHQNAGKLNEAENVYQQILNADPNQPIALHMLGVIAHQLGKNEVAVELITKALNIKPGYSEAYNNLGLIYAAGGDLEKATKYFQLGLQTNPTYATLYQNLSTLYAARAISAYRKALLGTEADESSDDSRTLDLLPLDMLGKR